MLKPRSTFSGSNLNGDMGLIGEPFRPRCEAITGMGLMQDRPEAILSEDVTLEHGLQTGQAYQCTRSADPSSIQGSTVSGT